MDFDKADLLAYMRSHRLGVLSSIGSDGGPQSALVGVAITAKHNVIFDTLIESRKHGNLERDARASVVFTGPDEKTLQLEGVARLISVAGEPDAELREIYYETWPDGRDRAKWPNISYWCIRPTWARYCDYGAGPLIKEFGWR